MVLDEFCVRDDDEVLLFDVLPDCVELLVLELLDELVVDVLDDLLLANSWNAPMLMCIMPVTCLLSWIRYCYCPRSGGPNVSHHEGMKIAASVWMPPCR